MIIGDERTPCELTWLRLRIIHDVEIHKLLELEVIGLHAVDHLYVGITSFSKHTSFHLGNLSEKMKAIDGSTASVWGKGVRGHQRH